MAHLVVCVLHCTVIQDIRRSETSVGDVVDPVLRLDEQVLQFVLGNAGFGGGVETAEDGGGNGVVGFGPWEKVIRRFTVGSANLQQDTERFENFGVALNTGEEICDAFGEGMGRRSS